MQQNADQLSSSGMRALSDQTDAPRVDTSVAEQPTPAPVKNVAMSAIEREVLHRGFGKHKCALMFVLKFPPRALGATPSRCPPHLVGKPRPRGENWDGMEVGGVVAACYANLRWVLVLARRYKSGSLSRRICLH